MFIHSRGSLENHTRPQTKMGKEGAKKRCKIPTLWGGTYLYGLYKEVAPRELQFVILSN